MITIYHLNQSRSERIIWLMEELGLPYRLEKYQRGPDMLAPLSLKRVSPLGKAPAIRDGELTLIESGAIVEYIINRHGGGRLGVSVSSPDYPRYVQWMHFGIGHDPVHDQLALRRIYPGCRSVSRDGQGFQRTDA